MGCELLTNQETDFAQSFDDWKAPPPFARGQLERLMLRGCKIGNAGALTLFGSEILSGLRAVDLGGCGLSEASTLEALRNSPHFTGLLELSVAGNNALEGSLTKLAGWSVLAKLQRLALPQVTSGAELTALFPKPSKHLRALKLSSAKALAKTPAVITGCAESLTELDLGTTSLGDEGWAQVLAAPCVEPLLELHAYGCSLSDEAVEVLTNSKLRRLGVLDLSSNKLTDGAFQALMAARQFAPVLLDVGKAGDVALLEKLRERSPGAVQAG